MTPTSTLAKTSTALRTVLAALVVSSVLSTQAGAVSLGVKLACASDYYSYCSQYPVGSLAVRQCMRAHGPQLSSRCIDALVSAGEVSKSEVDRKRVLAAAKKGGSRTVAAD